MDIVRHLLISKCVPFSYLASLVCVDYLFDEFIKDHACILFRFSFVANFLEEGTKPLVNTRLQLLLYPPVVLDTFSDKACPTFSLTRRTLPLIDRNSWHHALRIEL